MATTINADNVTGGAIVTGDNSGILQLQTGGVTAMTIGTDQSVTFAGSVVGAGGTYKATASGSLANGDKVIVNSDGTVSVVSGSSGSSNGGSTNDPAVGVYDSVNQKVIIVYPAQSTTYGTCRVGTISNNLITFGTPVVFLSASSGEPRLEYDVNAQKVVIVFTDGSDSNKGTAIVGTVSGTSISFGTKVAFNNYGTYHLSICYEPNAQKVVIAMRDGEGSNFYGSAIVGTVSGTSISFGTKTVFQNSASQNPFISYNNSATKLLITYTISASAEYAVVGTVSGTGISFGTPVSMSRTNSYGSIHSYDITAGKTVIVNSDSGTVKAVLGTISGTTVSFSSATNISSNSYYPSISYDSTNNKHYVVYFSGDTQATSIPLFVSGSTITLGSYSVFDSSSNNIGAYRGGKSIVYINGTNKSVAIYSRSSTLYTRVLIDGLSTNLTTGNFIGISSAAYTNGQTATIQIIGSVDDAQTGLTAGSLYYVLPDGTLSTTAGSPSVIAGTAVSATKLIIKG